MSSSTHASMMGKRCPTGTGGRNCTCCGQAPGAARVQARRVLKRRERQSWKKGLLT